MTTKPSASLQAPTPREGSPAPGFIDMLWHRSRNRSLPKKERTRFLFFRIVATAIQADATRFPTVEYLLDEATLSRGTFYNHFSDVDNCVFEMLQQFLIFSETIRTADRRNRGTHEAIRSANTWFCQHYAANANLFAAISKSAELGRQRAERNGLWARKVVTASERRRGTPYAPQTKQALEGVVRILITMTIEALRDRFVHNDALMSEAFPDSDALAITLSQIWYDAIAPYERADSPASSAAAGVAEPASPPTQTASARRPATPRRARTAQTSSHSN